MTRIKVVSYWKATKPRKNCRLKQCWVLKILCGFWRTRTKHTKKVDTIKFSRPIVIIINVYITQIPWEYRTQSVSFVSIPLVFSHGDDCSPYRTCKWAIKVPDELLPSCVTVHVNTVWRVYPLSCRLFHQQSWCLVDGIEIQAYEINQSMHYYTSLIVKYGSENAKAKSPTRRRKREKKIEGTKAL